MNAIGFMAYLLMAATTTPPSQDTLEILVVGPPEARMEMKDTLHPMLRASPALRWAEQESLPSDGSLPGSKGEDDTRLWIDVSNPSQLRLYIPAEQPRGTTIVKTLDRPTGDGTNDDLMTRETFTQMVKAAVLTLHDRLARRAEAAQQRRRDEERHAWEALHLHDGIHMRAQAGLGYLRASETFGSRDESCSKFGFSSNLAIGYALTKNLILHGELALTVVTIASDTANTYVFPSKGNLALASVGPGVTYYFPGNYRAFGTLGYAKLWFIDDRSFPPDSSRGIATSVGFGKEWMISQRLGLGIEGRFGYALLEHSFRIEWAPVHAEHYTPTIHATTFGLHLSATYN